MSEGFLGPLMTFDFGGTVFEALRNARWSQRVQVAMETVSGTAGAQVIKDTAGGEEWNFTFDVLVPPGSTGVTLLNNLSAGLEDTFEFHPEGDSADKIEFVATNAIIESQEGNVSPTEHSIASVTIQIDGDVTIQAAS